VDMHVYEHRSSQPSRVGELVVDDSSAATTAA
jgi:hypothetical protein